MQNMHILLTKYPTSLQFFHVIFYVSLLTIKNIQYSINIKSYTYTIFFHHLFFYNVVEYSIGVSSIILSIFTRS